MSLVCITCTAREPYKCCSRAVQVSHNCLVDSLLRGGKKEGERNETKWYHQTPLLREGGVPNGRGGRLSQNIVYPYFMFSPTTSPYRGLLLPEGGELKILLFRYALPQHFFIAVSGLRKRDQSSSSSDSVYSSSPWTMKRISSGSYSPISSLRASLTM